MAKGELTKFNEYRWMAVLQYVDQNGEINNNMLCSGTLITKKYVLTAAHCINSKRGRLLVLQYFLINIF